MRLGHRFLPVLLAIGVVSCGDDGPGPSPSAPARGTFLNMTSETGDYIGQGRPRNYTPDTTSFEGAVTCDGNQVRILRQQLERKLVVCHDAGSQRYAADIRHI